jgi:hypothetical protein
VFSIKAIPQNTGIYKVVWVWGIIRQYKIWDAACIGIKITLNNYLAQLAVEFNIIK